MEVSRPVAVSLEETCRQMLASQSVEDYIEQREKILKKLKPGEKEKFQLFLKKNHRNLLTKLANKVHFNHTDTASSTENTTTVIQFALKKKRRMCDVDGEAPDQNVNQPDNSVDNTDYLQRKWAFKRRRINNHSTRFMALCKLRDYVQKYNCSDIVKLKAQTILNIRFDDDEALKHKSDFRKKEGQTFRDSLKTNDGEPLELKIIKKMLKLIRQTNTNPSV